MEEDIITGPGQDGLETQYNRISGQTNTTFLDTTQKLQSYLITRCPPNLTVIRISGAKISVIAGVQFRENLTEINLSYNAITTLVGAQFPEGLTKLDLGYNSIQKLDGIHFPPNLTELLLNNNTIDSMSRVIFPVGLITLDLSNYADDGPNRNQIKSFNEVRFPNQLTELNLHDNPLETLGSIIDPFPVILDLIERQFPKIVRKYRQGATSKQISDLNQLSVHNQLRALTSYLREGMEHRSNENNERLKVKDDPNMIFVDAPNGVTYNVPLLTDKPMQYVLDYMNDNYYVSSLYPNCDVMRLVKKDGTILDLTIKPEEQRKDQSIHSGIHLDATPRNMQLAGGRTQNGKNKTHKKRWSMKYKRSINCRRPRGFSQRQHCKYGRGKSNPARD